MKKRILIYLCAFTAIFILKQPLLAQSTPQIGDLYNGGIVFYIPSTPTDLNGDGVLDYGLSAAPSDISSLHEWGCMGDWTSADRTAIGTGNQNTIDIVNDNCTSEDPFYNIPAAIACANLTLAGYDDWFLPSKDELNKMFLNLGPAPNNGFSSNKFYWSSTEFIATNAYKQNFLTGNTEIEDKDYYNTKARAIRAFCLDDDNDGVCNFDEIAGCITIGDCNYDSLAEIDDGSCVGVPGDCEHCVGTQLSPNDDDDIDGLCNEADTISGCTDISACNYAASPTINTNNTLCTYSIDLDACATCSGEIDGTGTIVDNDSDNDGVCNDDEIVGCQDSLACNYDATATDEDGSCEFLDNVCETCVTGVIVDNDSDNDGVCDSDEIVGCQDATACNYNASATDSGTCIYSTDLDACATCSGETDGTGVIVDNDLDNDGLCNDLDIIFGCTDTTACNYDASTTVNTDNNLCDMPSGCGDPLYLEYDSNVTCSDLNACITLIVYGCTDTTACNYDALANTDNGSCLTAYGCMDPTASNYSSNANCDNGSCTYINGCTDVTACNYDSLAIVDNGSCDLPNGCGDALYLEYDTNVTCSDVSACITLIVNGCTDATACNYDASANTDDGSCDLPDGCTDSTAFNYNSAATCDDGSCIAVIEGCMDATACNYDSDANTDDGSCAFSSVGNSSVTSCGMFMWEGQLLISSGDLTHIYTNAAGCDSTHTLSVIISESNTGNSSVTACNSYTWEGQTVSQNATLTHTYTNAAGCDSIHSLTINITTISAVISQEGSALSAITIPSYIDGNTDWFNIQTDDSGDSRIWLMEENTATFNPTFDCSYFIVVHDDFGCVDTSTVYYYAEQASRIGQMTIYPNPARDKVSVNFKNDNNQIVELNLINNNGVKIDEFMTVNSYLDIDLSNYPSGIYYLSFDSEENTKGCLKQEKERHLTKIILNK